MAKKKLTGKKKKIVNQCVIPKYKEHKEVCSEQEILADEAASEREILNWAELILDVPDVWRLTQGEGVKVTILDTGVDLDHPGLQEAIVDSKDFTGDGIEDENGHGTHCAGVVGARLNDVGFVGVAPKSELLIGKILGNNGSGAYGWIANGIYWAVEQDADVISMSLGGADSDNQLYEAIQYVLYYGKFVICAAGNEGSLYSNSVGYPGRYGGVITVVSHDRNGNPSDFSSRGGEVDVMAPGSEIWSTYKEGGYAELSGTSMATPFVAGLAALIASKHNHSTTNNTLLDNNEDMKNHLLVMATHPGIHDNKAGYGSLQPFNYFYN